jgi:hypothetical protein
VRLRRRCIRLTVPSRAQRPRVHALGKGCVGRVVHACTLHGGWLNTPSRLMRAVHCIVSSARPYRPLAVPCCALACGAVNLMLRAPLCDGSTLCARAPAWFGRVFRAHASARVLPYQIHPRVRMCHYRRASPRRKRRARRASQRLGAAAAAAAANQWSARRRRDRRPMQCGRHHHFRRRPPPRLSCC